MMILSFLVPIVSAELSIILWDVSESTWLKRLFAATSILAFLIHLYLLFYFFVR